VTQGQGLLDVGADANLWIMVTKFSDLDALSLELARQVAASLAGAISARGSASVVVSGGKSPVKLFEHLRAQALDWSRVHISLADERWVEPTDPSSNEKLVRDVLLKEHAAAAHFHGLKNAAPTPDKGAVSAWELFARIPRPLDFVLLGMGDDGHTASLFPHSPNLPSALNAEAAPGCVAMWSPTEPHARLSLNLSALLDARRIVILIDGPKKWATFTAAGESGPIAEMPVRAVLRQTQTPVEVMWSP
jgi:6-phosphogluconolactonase